MVGEVLVCDLLAAAPFNLLVENVLCYPIHVDGLNKKICSVESMYLDTYPIQSTSFCDSRTPEIYNMQP